MRIEGYIDHPKFKITVMKMNNRFSVKFEDGSIEQSYRYNQSPDIQNYSDIVNLVDEGFISEVEEIFQNMKKLREASIDTFKPEDGTEFPEIL